MRKKWIVFADCHKNAGKYEWPGHFEYGPNVVMLGDNHELKNISKSAVSRATSELYRHVDMCKSTDTIIVASNHGVSIEKEAIGRYISVRGDVAFIHGHRAVYSQAKAEKWENREPGVSWYVMLWQRWFKRRKYSPSKYKKPSKSTLKKVAAYAKEFGVRRIVTGHFHQEWRGTYKGVEMQFCGRGKSEIEI